MGAWLLTELAPGVRLHCMQTTKFHSGYFSIELLRPLTAEDASRNALIMNVLRRGTRTYPDMTRVSEALNELYGAVVSPVMRQMGETLTIGLQSMFPDDRYLPDEKRHLEKIVSFCGEMLLDPVTRGGLLNDEYVRSERQNLHDRISAAVNDKRSYARLRLRKLMFAGEPYGIYPLGEAEDALKVHYQALTKFYKQLLRTAPMELYYCGSASPERVENAVREAMLTLPTGGSRLMPVNSASLFGCEYRQVTEEMDVEQGNLAIGFRMQPGPAPDYPALAVFEELYGGGPSSRLFRNVREKRSLCYSVGCGTDRFKRVMTVSAGIGFDKRAETEEAVFAELDAIRNGDFTSEELETAKQSAAASYRGGLDSPGSVCTFHLAQDFLTEPGDLNTYASLALAVTAENVMAAAQRMRPELSYFLRKGVEA